MTKRAILATDLYKLHSVTNPKIAPNGKEAVFLKTMMDEERNDYVTHLYHVDLNHRKVTQWTHHTERMIAPKWSPDSQQLAFLSNRAGEASQLFIMSAKGGEAKQVTNLPKGVSNYFWSPCQTKCWIEVPLKEGDSFETTEEKKDSERPEPIRVTKMKYKSDGIGLVPQQVYRQIGLLDLATGKVEPFTEGNHHHSLEAVSNDGTKFVMSVNRSEQQDFEFHKPLYVVDVPTKQETVIIEDEGYYGHVSFSLTDRYIAFIGTDRSLKNATHTEVYIYDHEQQTTIKLTEGIDAPVGDYIVADHQQGVTAQGVVWTNDDHLYFQLSSMGDVRLYFATVDGAIYPATAEREHVYGFDVARDGEIALLTVSHPTHPGELYQQTIATGEREALTTFNAAFLEEVAFVSPEPVQFERQGEMIHGWLMKPFAFEKNKKYPLILNIHGGPHVMYGHTFFHEMQLLAAQGWGVLYTNPRGSHGYHQQFVDAVRGDYGGGDYADLMAAVDQTIEQNDWIDVEKLGVTGGSYGGFMTNWIVGHTHRFTAAVTQRSISNWVSFFGVSDIGYYFTDWQIGTTMTDPETLWHYSPLKYAAQIETPLLILHGEQDFRCPIEQAEQLYITLKSMGKVTEFVRFPQADHNLSRTGKPHLRLARLQEIVQWFTQYFRS